MANIKLNIDDPINRMTLKAMLEADGHRIADDETDVVISDDLEAAPTHEDKTPTLVLATPTQIRQAVNAMRQGVYGYISLPFVPREASIMVQRALAANTLPKAPAPEEPPMPLEEVEASHILATLRHCKGNQAKAARALGIGRNTLWRKLKRIKKTGTARI